MAFKFAFDGLLKHRKSLEEVAKRDYLLAKAKVDEILKEINDMYLKTSQTREEIVQLHQRGGALGAFLSQKEEFIDGLDKKIHLARGYARELMQIAEEKQEALIISVKEHKMIEKLKEKKIKEHIRLTKKKEMNEMNDMSTMRFKKR